MIKSLNKVIVTAADEFYFRTLCQFIHTFNSQKEYINSELICYDLGFNSEQKSYLDGLIIKIPNLSVRKFEFDQYPNFVKLEYRTYSFKPIIIKKVLEEKKKDLLWLDSATILLKPLDNIWRQLNEVGLYTPKSGRGTLAQWTIQATLDYMEVPTSYYKHRNVSGGVCGFSYSQVDVRNLVSNWERYSLIRECIKPDGANRSNHRDDQSLLTILVYKFQEKTGIRLTKDEVNISATNPVDTYSVMNKLKPNFPYYLNWGSVFYFNLRRRIDILVNRWKS